MPTKKRSTSTGYMSVAPKMESEEEYGRKQYEGSTTVGPSNQPGRTYSDIKKGIPAKKPTPYVSPKPTPSKKTPSSPKFKNPTKGYYSSKNIA